MDNINFTTKATDTKGKVEVVIQDGYGYEIENDKLYFVTKKKEYPKTYRECCDILDCYSYNVGFDRCKSSTEEVLHDVLLAFRELYICRDAYWKIAGEKMGLGKPWEPVYQDDKQDKHCIYVDIWGITLCQDNIVQHVLSFPTEEMRDAFYEAFKKEIEICKELL